MLGNSKKQVSQDRKDAFVELTRHGFIILPIPENYSLAGYRNNITDKRYSELCSALFSSHQWLSLDLEDVFEPEELETILDNQSLLECELFDHLTVYKKPEEIEAFLLKTTQDYKTNMYALGIWLYRHPDRETLPFFKNWTRGQLVEAYLSLVERDDCHDVLDDLNSMGYRALKLLDDKGFDTTGMTKSKAQGLFNIWCTEPVKRKFSARRSDIRKALEESQKIKAHQGGLKSRGVSEDMLRAAHIKEILDEAAKRPDRRRGRNNPTGGKVGYGKKAPRL
jgi:hypothetical protein